MTDAIPTYGSHAEIIDAFGGHIEFGQAIGISTPHARTMKTRDSIPSGRWNSVVAAAEARGFRGITLEVLARIDEARLESRKPEAEEAAQ